MRTQHGKLLLAAGLLAMIVGCDKSADSFSLLGTQATFQQVGAFAPKKIDILWVIDNSGSMATSQSNLASNFASFIHRFNQSNYDFHMGVVTTDAWEKRFNSASTKARLRDGLTTHTGVFVMDKNTPNLSNVFVTDILQGTNGNGDERALDSFKYSLLESFNVGKGFRRDDAFLAVIMVGDEDDYSTNNTSSPPTGPLNYSNPNLMPVSGYVTFLDTFTNRAAGAAANYSVSAITVMDAACKAQLETDANIRTIGVRYMDIATRTGGVKGSLCSDFGNTLQLISDSIIELSSTFQLDRAPNPSTIVIEVDGVLVQQNATNGWTYDATTVSVTFHGSSVPVANSNITIAYDPMTVKQ